MFSLVGKKKLYRETTKQPLSCDVFLPHSVWSFTNWHTVLLFFMLPWHLSCSESTLWNLWLKKKKLYPSLLICGGHKTHRYVLNLCNLVINVDPFCPLPYLSPVLLNHRESQGLQKLWLWMPILCEYDAKGVPYLLPARSLMPFSSLMIHLPIIKRGSLSCLVCFNKA